MNEGRLFLYVSPKVVLPFMFLMMAITSLLVHATILTHTTWMAAFYEGGAAKAAKADAAAPAVAAAPAAAASAEATPAP